MPTSRPPPITSGFRWGSVTFMAWSSAHSWVGSDRDAAALQRYAVGEEHRQCGRRLWRGSLLSQVLRRAGDRAGFFFHIGEVIYRALVKKERGMFWGPTSLVPQPQDLIDIYRQFRWFFWLGPKPRFGRYTYWEKFDYWAVFWGMAIIGVSGYMMWFAAFFARFVPGYMFNVALLVHGEEALLAIWFIFMIHFFNTHLRPEKFPMDPVIFTGRESGEDLRHERPAEYQRLVEQQALQALETEPPPRWLKNFAGIIAVAAVGTGFFLLAVTLIAFFAGF